MEYSERRRAQARQTEQAILHAAMELSRRDRFDRVSVRDICREAGITTGAFYHHFKSKEELLLRGFAPLDSYMEEALAGREDAPPARRLWIILSSYAAFMENMGWELVARYYQQRLNAPESRSMDASRFTHRAMLGCLREAREAESSSPVRAPSGWRIFFSGTSGAWSSTGSSTRGAIPFCPSWSRTISFFRGCFKTGGRRRDRNAPRDGAMDSRRGAFFSGTVQGAGSRL